MPKYFPKNQTKHSCLIDSLFDLCNQGKLREAVESLSVIARQGIRLNNNTITYLIKECARTKSLREGKNVHMHLRYTGFKRPSTVVSNWLMNMYFECGDFKSARQVFDKMSVRNLFSWNNAISGYVKIGMMNEAVKIFGKMEVRDVISWNTVVIGFAQCGRFDEAIEFYREFRKAGIGFNPFSFAGVLTVGLKLRDLGLNKQVHCQVFVGGFMNSLILSSSILDSYAKCGEMKDARRLFDEMEVRDIPAWTSLISGYCKWGDMEMAKLMFDSMPQKNPVAWTAMVSGYARNNLGQNSLDMFRRMMFLRIPPDQFTFSTSLNACASLTSLNHGKQIHAYMVRIGFRPNTIVISSLIDMYSKCGSLSFSTRIFLLMANKKDVMSWNPYLAALSQHGLGDEAIKLFDDMVRFRVEPNRVTFVVILSACSHSGLVQQGLKFFKFMTDYYNIHPDVEHYTCLIDLLGRAGFFDELVRQLEIMPCKDDERIWNALVGVCRIHDNIELGKKAAEQVIERDPHSYAPYLFLSSIHAACGNWECVEMTRKLVRERCVRKPQASSWIESDKVVHSRTS